MITDRKQLAALPAPPRLAVAPAPRASLETVPDEPGPWLIPPPSNGVAYTAAEVAEITGAAEATVRTWVSRGLKIGRERVKLQTLRVPRGLVTPPGLCAFLAVVNGIEVTIGKEICPWSDRETSSKTS